MAESRGDLLLRRRILEANSNCRRPGAALLLRFLLYAIIDSLIIPTNLGRCLLLCTAKGSLKVSKCWS